MFVSQSQIHFLTRLQESVTYNLFQDPSEKGNEIKIKDKNNKINSY